MNCIWKDFGFWAALWLDLPMFLAKSGAFSFGKVKLNIVGCSLGNLGQLGIGGIFTACLVEKKSGRRPFPLIGWEGKVEE